MGREAAEDGTGEGHVNKIASWARSFQDFSTKFFWVGVCGSGLLLGPPAGRGGGGSVAKRDSVASLVTRSWSVSRSFTL